MDFKILILQFLNTNDSTINVLDQEQITVMELLFKGGFMMIPILILFVITIYILIEKILIINRESKSPKGFTDEIISRVKNDDINGAKLICNDTNNPVSRMILKGLNKFNTSLKNIETSIENVGKIEIYNLSLIYIYLYVRIPMRFHPKSSFHIYQIWWGARLAMETPRRSPKSYNI